MMRETELGSNSPKLLASFKIKMARSSASLIFVPEREIQCAAQLFALSLHRNNRILGSSSSAGDRLCIIYQVPKSFDCFSQVTPILPRLE